MFLCYFHHYVPNLSSVSSRKCQLRPEAQQQLLEADLEYLTRTITQSCEFSKAWRIKSCLLQTCLSPRDFLPEQSVQNLAQSISTGSVTRRNNAGSCSHQSGKLSVGFAQSKRRSFTLTQLQIWKARQHSVHSIQHQGWHPEPQKRVTELLWARLELLPKLDNFQTRLKDTSAPRKINSHGRSFLISPVAPATLKHGFGQRAQWAQMIPSFLSQTVLVKDVFLHLLSILPSTTFGQPVFGWKRQEHRSCCWATKNKKVARYSRPILPWLWAGMALKPTRKP